MDKKTKDILIVAGIVLVLLIIVGWWFYRKGSKKVTIAPPVMDNPNVTPGSTQEKENNPYGINDASIALLAGDLFREMDGVNIWRNLEPYHRLIVLSDTDFSKVYNAFNEANQQESGQTLREWIEAEKGIGEFAILKDRILEKMDRLKLI